MKTAENYFDEIYTMHLNEFVRMPKVELYELMTDFAKEYHKEQLTLTDVVKSDNELLPDFLYKDDYGIKIGYHGDTEVSKEWKEYLEKIR